MTALEWEACNPAPSPFGAAVGDFTEYRVYYAKSTANTESELDDHLLQIIQKAFSFAPANVDDGVTRLVFFWDGVYAMLTVVYTDEAMERHAHHVTKCYFVAIDEKLYGLSTKNLEAWTEVKDEFSEDLRHALANMLASIDLSVLPPPIEIHFSDGGRDSNDSSKIVAHCLTSRWS